MNPLGRKWSRRVAVVLLPLLVAVGLQLFVMRGFVVRGASMKDTLLPGDWILVNKAAIGSVIPGLGSRIPGYAPLRRYGVVVVDFGRQGTWGSVMAKRVVGLPGDTLQMVDGVLMINGVVDDEPYASEIGDAMNEASLSMNWQLGYVDASVDAERYFPTMGNWGPIVIPPNRYFVLGDNRRTTIDSREIGLVSPHSVVGRVDRVILSHDGSCCSPLALIRGFRWSRAWTTPPGR